MKAVRKHQLEGMVAKGAASPYRSGERSSDWFKWSANHGQEFVVGGYIPNGNILDSLLVGYYDGRQFPRQMHRYFLNSGKFGLGFHSTLE